MECLSKLLEKVVAKRLLHDIRKFNLVPTNQFGARPHLSTTHARLALVHDISTTHAHSGCCASLQFNIQGFFDNISHAVLVRSCRRMGFAPNVCDWLESFLEGRSAQLQFNAFISDPIPTPTGTPQGSPISPVLSIIYTAGLLQKSGEWSDCNLFMYIDDGNILASGPSYKLVAALLTKHF